MTKLDEMWDALAKYQDIADDDGHGKTWSDMCRLKTVEACRAAGGAVYAPRGLINPPASASSTRSASQAASAVDYAAAASGTATEVEYWTQEAIKRINQATGETE